MYVCMSRNEIPSEIFVAQTRYNIASKDVLTFEQAFNKVSSSNNNKEGGVEDSTKGDGFVGSFLQRRDATKVRISLSIAYMTAYTYM